MNPLLIICPMILNPTLILYSIHPRIPLPIPILTSHYTRLHIMVPIPILISHYARLHIMVAALFLIALPYPIYPALPPNILPTILSVVHPPLHKIKPDTNINLIQISKSTKTPHRPKPSYTNVNLIQISKWAYPLIFHQLFPSFNV